MVRRVWVVSKIPDEAVLLRIGMDVVNHPAEVRIRIDPFAAKRTLKETTGPGIRFIDRLSIAIEQVRKLATNDCRAVFRRFFHSDEQMKMIFQQTVGVGFGYRRDVFGVSLKKKRIVPLLFEYPLSVVSPIINVVNHTGFQRKNLLHGLV